jgi:hypothetical protein
VKEIEKLQVYVIFYSIIPYVQHATVTNMTPQTVHTCLAVNLSAGPKLVQNYTNEGQPLPQGEIIARVIFKNLLQNQQADFKFGANHPEVKGIIKGQVLFKGEMQSFNAIAAHIVEKSVENCQIL